MTNFTESAYMDKSYDTERPVKESKSAISRLICRLLPGRAKRLMFVYSVLGYVNNDIKHNEALVKSVNDVFRLARRPEACKIPIMLNSVIWKDSKGARQLVAGDIDSKLTITYKDRPRPKDELVKYFVQTCPYWLRYGDTADMQRDLFKAFSAVRTYA